MDTTGRIAKGPTAPGFGDGRGLIDTDEAGDKLKTPNGAVSGVFVDTVDCRVVDGDCRFRVGTGGRPDGNAQSDCKDAKFAKFVTNGDVREVGNTIKEAIGVGEEGVRGTNNVGA